MAYRPNPPDPFETRQARWLYDETDKIAREFVDPKDFLAMRVLYAAPAKAKPGQMVYADGVTWNPGSGEGVYRRTLAGTWVFVG